MDWPTFAASVATSVIGSGLIVGLLTWWLDRRRFGHQQAMDVSHLALDKWQRVQQSFENEIDSWEKAGDTTNANEARREYALQQVAWRAQQGVNALAPREVRPEGGPGLPQEQLDQLERLLAEAARLNPSALAAEDYFRRGSSHFLAGRHQEALADLNRALELKPDYPDALKNLDLIGVERLRQGEQGTWTPRFSFTKPGDLEVNTIWVQADYWELGPEWLIEAQFAATPMYTSAEGNAVIAGLPTVPKTGHYTVEWRVADGPHYVRSGRLGRSAEILLPDSTDGFPAGLTYQFDVSARYIAS
jgi:tetratricopeptide (TPR) repeat protein